MNIFHDDRIPTPEECIQEFTYKSQLEKLEKECAYKTENRPRPLKKWCF